MAQIVKNNPSYWAFIRELKNDKTSRENSMHSHEITVEEHRSYMKRHGDKYYICLEDSTPVGYVGFNASGYISIAVVEDSRKKGLAKQMLTYVSQELEKKDLKAIVHISNLASVRLFEACGFVKQYYIFEGEEQ